jgi:hypothetical protein
MENLQEFSTKGSELVDNYQFDELRGRKSGGRKPSAGKQRRAQTKKDRIARRTKRKEARATSRQKNLDNRLASKERRKSLRQNAKERRVAIRQKAREKKLMERKGLSSEDLQDQELSTKGVNYQQGVEDELMQEDQTTADTGEIQENPYDNRGEEEMEVGDYDPTYDMDAEEGGEEDNYSSYNNENVYFERTNANKKKIANYVAERGIKPSKNVYELSVQAQKIRDDESDDMYFFLVDEFIAEGENEKVAESLADETCMSFMYDNDKYCSFDGFAVLDPALWNAIGKTADKGLVMIDERRGAKGKKKLFQKDPNAPVTDIDKLKGEFTTAYGQDKFKEFLPLILIVVLGLIYLGMKSK